MPNARDYVDSLEDILGVLHRGLGALYKARLVRLVLFGFCARGKSADNSDVDVLVVLGCPLLAGQSL